jgi:hypothetical protein
MKIAFFDCFAGISGDMILGALFDCGLDQTLWRRDLAKLNLPGYEVEVNKVEKQHIAATKVSVKVKESSQHRKLSDVLSLINQSSLDSEVKQKSSRIFTRLAQAEAKVHGKNPEEVHFHEVGAIDAIVDVVGSVLGLKLLQAEEIYASPLPLSRGLVKTTHGNFPVPAPATVELLSGWPVKNVDVDGELVTPTGAAIITTLAKFQEGLDFIPLKTGYGAGDQDFKEFPNVLRVILGEKVSKYEQDQVVVLETNLDNTEPQILGYLIEKLMNSGAKDAFFTPATMKKNRPGVLLTVLADSADSSKISEIIFRETYTSGIRMRQESRLKLPRRIVEVETVFGPARVKLVGEDSNLEVLPEFEDCKTIAQKNNLPFKTVYEKIREAYLNQKEKK